jgi:hypothetical protein
MKIVNGKWQDDKGEPVTVFNNIKKLTSEL